MTQLSTLEALQCEYSDAHDAFPNPHGGQWVAVIPFAQCTLAEVERVRKQAAQHGIKEFTVV